jgi:CubicO group peptidase (beta-lactamase class C family)
MKRNYAIVILVTLFCLLISSTAWAELSTAKPEDVGLSSERLNRISVTLKAHTEKGVIPGAVALVARKGKIAYFESFGMRDLETSSPMQKDTIFKMYSMTKPITSVGLMMLHEQGHIFLGDPVSKYIPAFKEVKVGVEGKDSATGVVTLSTVPAQRQITIHDLLRHTSGLTHDFIGKSKINMMYKEAGLRNPEQTLDEMVMKICKLPLACQPGTKWNYSLSTDVLGRVIEIVSGKSLDKYFEERIFQPLQMNDTGFYVKPEKIERVAKPGPKAKWPSRYATSPPKLLLGGSGLVSTAHDYMRFMQMLMNGGQLDGVRLLGKNTVEYITTDHLGSSIPKQGPAYFPGPGAGFGLGFAVREFPGVSRIAGSVGDYSWIGAGGTNFFVNPREELCAVFMTQANDMALMAFYARLYKNLVMAAIVD